MNTKQRVTVVLVLAISLIVSSCAPGQLFGPTITPTPTLTATPRPTATLVPVYGCTDSKALNYNAQATSNDGSCQYATATPPEPTPIPAGGTIVSSGMDLTITSVSTPASYKVGTLLVLTPKEGFTLVVVRATVHKHGSTKVADWTAGGSIDSLLPDGSRANKPSTPYLFSNKLPLGQTEWIFWVSTDVLQSNPLVLVLPDDVSARLALPPLLPNAIPTSNSTAIPSSMGTAAPALGSTITPLTGTTNNPFYLLGVWKTDDMRAPDNSWSNTYSIYMKFTNTKQYVYNGIESFNNNEPTDEADLVYLDNDNSIFIKRLVNIPDHPEYLGKYEKWTWQVRNGNVLFTFYGIVDSQNLALSDTNVTGLATGVKVP
jgi:hypothetical protein